MLVNALTCLLASETALAQRLAIGSMYKAPLSTTDGTGLIDLITKERFKRIGVNLDIQLIPGAGSLDKANAGI